MYEPSRNLMSFDIAGFSHWYGLEVIDQLEPGTELRLVSEPDNPYDGKAVAIYFEKTKIGFVPRALNDEISPLLYYGHGDIFSCRVAKVDKTSHPEHQVMATIFIKDAR